MSKDKASTTEEGDIDEKLKVVVEQSMAKQVAEVVESLKAAATKGSDSGTSPGTSRNSGGSKYRFLLKGMTSCLVRPSPYIRLNGRRKGPQQLGTKVNG